MINKKSPYVPLARLEGDLNIIFYQCFVFKAACLEKLVMMLTRLKKDSYYRVYHQSSYPDLTLLIKSVPHLIDYLLRTTFQEIWLA